MADNTSTERRRFARVPFDAEATLWLGSCAWRVHQADVSLAGAMVEMPQDVEIGIGQQCELHLRLAASVCITMKASIVFSVGRRIGIRCSGIDLDSLTHLRRLLEMNVGGSEIPGHDLVELIAGRS